MKAKLIKVKREMLAILVTLVLLAFITSATLPRAVSGMDTLYWGSSGSDVRTCQWKLSQWGYYKGSIDGVFANDTAQAVRDFQQRNGLVADGVVGPSTWTALGYPSPPAQTAPVSTAGVSQSDNVELLARAITGEARGEPYIGQVAVGAVLLNRMKNPLFPNTLAGIIYQPGAFESVSNGQINQEPTADARRAASDALSGWDPTYGCIYFFNPAKTSNAFIWSRNMITQIGKHKFAI